MSTAVSQTWYMTQRQLMVFTRQPAYAIITLIQPVIWLFLFGNLFKKAALMNGNVVNNGLITAFQSVVIVLLALAGGADYPGGIGGIAILVLASVLLGTVFGALSNALGMLVQERESIIGINTFLLLPLTFLSSAFMATSQMPSWMRHIADFNPLNWAMVAGRSALSEHPDWGDVLSRGGALLALAVAAVWLSIRTFRSYQRSV
jgi:ABC-2 type transport system permease protein